MAVAPRVARHIKLPAQSNTLEGAGRAEPRTVLLRVHLERAREQVLFRKVGGPAQLLVTLLLVSRQRERRCVRSVWENCGLTYSVSLLM